MAEQKFKVGDVVVLKSGSLAMTVTGYAVDVDGNQYVSCEWHDNKNGFGQRNFVEDSVEIYEAPQLF